MVTCTLLRVIMMMMIILQCSLVLILAEPVEQEKRKVLTHISQLV